MASLEQSAGFLRGILEGMELDESAPQGKLLRGIVDLLGELCDRTEALDEMLAELNEYVEDIDDDLARLEGDEGGDGEEFGFEDDYDDIPFGGEDQLHLLSGDKDKRAGEAKGALEGGLCPECGGIAFIAKGGSPEDRYVCPHCGKAVQLRPLTEENAPIARPAED